MQFKTTLGKSSYWKRTKRRKKGIEKQRTGGGSLSMVLTSSMSIPESAYTWQQYGVRLRVQTRPIPLTAKKSEAKKKDSTLEGSTKVLIHTIELLIHKHVLTWRKNTYSTYKLEKEAKMASLVQPEQIAKSSADNIETAPVPSFALLCGRSYPYLQWKKTRKPSKNGSEKVPWKTEKRRRKGRMRWDVVEEELRHCPGYRESGICDHAKERVVFSFFFFLALRCAGVFWISAGSLAAVLTPLSGAKMWTFPFVFNSPE